MTDSIRDYLIQGLADEAGPCRLVHGRGGAFGGACDFINVDRFQSVILIYAYSAVAESAIGELGDFFQRQAERYGVSCIAVQRRYLDHSPTEIVYGRLLTPSAREEHGLRYQLSIGARQNVGFFPDMFAMRKWFLENSGARRILNLFAYTCSISVAAVAGGAQKVVNVDMSGPALSTGRENHRLNGLDVGKAEFHKLHILKSWGRLGRKGPYDIIFADPPTFQAGSFDTDRDYPKVVRRTAQMLCPGGILIVCSNSPSHPTDFLKQTIRAVASELTFIQRLPNHPRFDNVNSEQALKVLMYQAP